MPATVIAERVGWERSIRVLSGRVAELRPAYLPPDPASRTSYVPGEIAQCDFWFPDITLPVGFGQARTAKQLPALTMVAGYSRWLSGVLVPSRHAEAVRRVVAADRGAGVGAAGAGVGRGGRGRPVAGREAGADRCLPGVPRHPGREGDHLPTGRPDGRVSLVSGVQVDHRGPGRQERQRCAPPRRRCPRRSGLRPRLRGRAELRAGEIRVPVGSSPLCDFRRRPEPPRGATRR
jgi:hypothetical protein